MIGDQLITICILAFALYSLWFWWPRKKAPSPSPSPLDKIPSVKDWQEAQERLNEWKLGKDLDALAFHLTSSSVFPFKFDFKYAHPELIIIDICDRLRMNGFTVEHCWLTPYEDDNCWRIKVNLPTEPGKLVQLYSLHKIVEQEFAQLERR